MNVSLRKSALRLSVFSRRGGAAALAPLFWTLCASCGWTDSRTMAASRSGLVSVSDRSCRSLRGRSCSVCAARASAVRTSRQCKHQIFLTMHNTPRLWLAQAVMRALLFMVTLCLSVLLTYVCVCVCDEGLRRSVQDFSIWMTFSDS